MSDVGLYNNSNYIYILIICLLFFFLTFLNFSLLHWRQELGIRKYWYSNSGSQTKCMYSSGLVFREGVLNSELGFCHVFGRLKNSPVVALTLKISVTNWLTDDVPPKSVKLSHAERVWGRNLILWYICMSPY